MGLTDNREENKAVVILNPYHHSLVRLLFQQFGMQLQGAMPIECEHIINQHGGTAFTEEITHYAAVSHKNIFQLHFHCIC